jgi:hypothetical protein
MYLRFGHRVIVEALMSDPLAKIVIPSNEVIASYKEAVGEIYQCVVHNVRAQAVLAAVGKYQDPGSFLQRVDAWSLRDIGVCFLPDHSHCFF